MNIFATVHFRNNRWFAQPRAGVAWAVDDEQVEEFQLWEGKEVWIRCHDLADQFCRIMSVERSVA